MSIKKSLIIVLTLWSGLMSHSVFAQLQVFACEPEWAALARELGGDQLEIFTATTAKQDPHHIQARPSLIARARRADILFCTGAELEVGWLPVLLRKSGNGKILPGKPGHFMAADHVQLLEKPEKLDRSMGDVHAAGNPHAHLDPYRVIKIAEAFVTTVSTLDRSHEATYKKSLTDFLQTWKAAIRQWEQTASGLRGKPVVVDHNSWVYLEQWLGLERAATLEPRPGIPPSSRHLAKVLNAMQHTPADKILTTEHQDHRAAHWLNDKTGIQLTDLPLSPDKDEKLIDWFNRLIRQLTQ